MKNQIILAALLLSSTCAFAGNGYVGINAGSTEQTLSFEGDKYKEDTTGVRVYGGYQVNPGFGVEVGYAHFGKLSDSEDGLSVSFKPTAIYAAATGTMAISPSMNVIGKLGVSRNETKFGASFEGDSVSVEKSNSSVMIGIGVQYKFSDTMSLVAEYENFGKVAKLNEGDFKADMKASLVSVGLRVAF